MESSCSAIKIYVFVSRIISRDLTQLLATAGLCDSIIELMIDEPGEGGLQLVSEGLMIGLLLVSRGLY